MKNTVKKVLLFSVVAVLMACFAFCVSAAEIEETGYCGNDVTYTLYDDGKLVISGTGQMYWYSWENICEDIEKIKSVVIGNGVTSVGGSAFADCSNLTSVTLPDTLTAIYYNAFYGCTSLKSINIPDSVTIIEDQVFYDCESLESIILPDGIKTVYPWTFQYCESLKSISIPDSVTKIEVGAFACCTSLRNVILPEGIKNIEAGAFSDCSSLKSIVLPEGITFIDEGVFSYCSALTTVALPKTLTKIYDEAFYGCDNITDVYYGGAEEMWASLSCAFPSSVKVHFSYSDHTHNYVVTKEVAPTCMSVGEIISECSICGETKKGAVSKVPHSYSGSYTTDKAATCSQIGSKSRHCIYKGCTAKTDITSVPKIAHTKKTVKAVPATCEKNGSTEKIICSKCNYVIKAASVISATGHSFKDVITKASTTKDGKTESKCSKCNKVDTSKIIYKASYINLSETNYIYNGKVRKPYVYVNASNRTYLVKGRDYTVTFSDNKSKAPGKYKVTITFIGNYTGSKVLEYTILPKDTSLKSLAAGPSAITVNWSKQTLQTTGYEIQYSTKKNFKSAKTIAIKKNKTVSKKITGLKGKTKYYVRIRTYKAVGKTKIYSAWSSAKSVTTKPNTGVILNTTAVTLYTGGTKTVKASVYPSGTKIKWSTDKKSVATVSGGKIKAVKKGKAVITASFKYKGKTYKATCKVTVKNPTLKLNKTSLTLDEGKSATLKATATPACTVTWKTSDKTVATVSKNGKIKAVGYGTAKITAKITYGGKTYSKSCKVTVNETCDHLFLSYYDTDVEPTCTKPGYESRYCAYCDEKTDTRQIKAKGHSFDDWVITVAATPQKEGVKTRTCSRCKHKETKAVVTGEMYSRPLSGQSGQVITVGPRKMKITVTKVLTGSEANALAVSEYSNNKGHGNGKEWRIYFFDVEYISSENGYGDTLSGSDIINSFGSCVYTSKGVSVSTSKYAVFGGKYRGQSNLDLKLVPGSSGKMVFGFLTDTGLGDLVLRLATNVYYTTDPVTWLSLAPPSASVAPDTPGSSTGKNAEENLTALKQYILENGEVAAQGKTRRLTKEFTKNGYEYFAYLSYNISEESISFNITSDSGSGIPDTIIFTMKDATSPLTVTSYLYDYSGYVIGNSTGTISLTPSAYSIPSDYSFNWTTVYKNPGAPGSYDPYNSIAGTNGSKRATSLLDLGFATWNSMILEATGMGMDNIGFTSY